MKYEHDTRDRIEVKQELYHQGEDHVYYPHYLYVTHRDGRSLVDRGFIETIDPHTVNAHYVLTQMGAEWLREHNVDFIARRASFTQRRLFRIEVATREQAMLVKLAWS